MIADLPPGAAMSRSNIATVCVKKSIVPLRA
jgi:hypothetical protein